MAWSHALIDRYDPEDVLPLAAMKAELDVTHDDDDELITSHRDAGISFVEEYTSRYLGPVTIAFATDQAPASGIRLPIGPVTSVTSLSVGGETVADYVSLPGAPSLLLPPAAARWPLYTPSLSAVAVAYSAGYAIGDCPKILIQAAKLMAGIFFDRSDDAEKETLAVQNLIRSFKFGS